MPGAGIINPHTVSFPNSPMADNPVIDILAVPVTLNSVPRTIDADTPVASAAPTAVIPTLPNALVIPMFSGVTLDTGTKAPGS